MIRITRGKWALALCAWLAVTGATAQQYPVRPVHMVVTFAPGGGADIIARSGQDLYAAWRALRSMVFAFGAWSLPCIGLYAIRAPNNRNDN